MEVGACHDGFCDPLSMDTTETLFGIGDCGPTIEVGTFFSHADDLHIGGILPVVYLRDCSVTWNANVHSVG